MSTRALTSGERHEIQRQVGGFLGRSPAFRGLAPQRQREVASDTARLVERLAEGPRRRSADPYAMPLGTMDANSSSSTVDTSGDQVEGRMTGNVDALLKNKQAQIGSVVGAGVSQAARMVKEIDFPAFVSSLIEGTFHAIVKSSIEQMKAYADMVKSVATSLNDFKDQNTTDNQARDSLVQRYPQHFQINVTDGQPSVGLKDGADDLPVPDFQRDLGMSEDISSLDDDTIEQKLVPAARDDLARGRQQLLATIILMGINRIVVTDGKINAKLKFQFSAREQQQQTASAYDYVKTGNVYASQGTYQNTGGSGGSDGSYQQGSQQGNYQSSVTPDVRVTSEIDQSSVGALQASGQIMGEVNINFKSDVFPLEKMVDSGQMMQLQNAQQGAGRGAPPSGSAPGSAGAAAKPPAAGAPGPAPVQQTA
jgi:hypothetical protein